MMRRLLIIFALLFQTIVWGQDFYKQFSGEGFDSAKGVAEMNNGDYLITGNSSSFSDEPSQMFVLKLTANGVRISSKSYGSEEADGGKKVKVLSNDNYFVGGYSQTTNGNSYDMAVWKFNEFDDLLWTKNYGTTAFDQVLDMIVTSDNGMIILGETWDTSDGFADILIVKIDVDGNEIWRKKYGGVKENKGYTIQKLTSGIYCIGGTWYDETSDKKQGFLMKINELDGTQISHHLYNIGTEAALNSILIPDNQNFIFAVGEYNNAQGVQGALWLKINIGDGSIDYEELNAVNMKSKSVGIVKYENDFCIANVTNGEHSFGLDGVLIFECADPLYWLSSLGGVNHLSNQVYGEIISLRNDDLLMVGMNEDWGPGGSTIFVYKKSKNTSFFLPTVFNNYEPLVSVSKVSEIQNVKVFPNPILTDLQIELPEGNYTLNVLTLEGKVIIQKEINGNSTIDFTNVSNGTYLVEMIDQQSGNKKTIKGVKL